MKETKPNFSEYQRANLKDIPAVAAGGVMMVAEFVAIIGSDVVNDFIERRKATAASIAFHFAPILMLPSGRNNDIDHTATAW